MCPGSTGTVRQFTCPFVCAQNLAKPESVMFYISDAENTVVLSQEPIEERAVTPSPEQVFAECSQKRILGLLAAMLPPIKLVRDQWHFLLWRKGGGMCRKVCFLESRMLNPPVQSCLCVPERSLN